MKQPTPHWGSRLQGARLTYGWVKRVVKADVAALKSIPKDTWWMFACIATLLAAQLTMIWANEVGIYLNVLGLAVLISMAMWRKTLRKLCISLAILPVTQLAASTIISGSIFRTNTAYYGVLLLITLAYRYLFTLDEPVAASQLKLRGHIFGLPLMIFLGEIAGAVDYAFLRNRFHYSYVSLPLMFLSVVVFAFAEEMYLRGLVQPQADKVINPIYAIILTTSLYTVLSIDHATMLTVVPALVTGLMLAVTYYFKRNLLLTTAINATAKLTYVGLVATFILR